MGIFDSLDTPEGRSKAGQTARDVVNRGVAGLLGGPVDLAALALKPLGYDHPAPIGGSEWVGNLMQQAGIVSPDRYPLPEFLASVALPFAAPAGAKAVGALASGVSALKGAGLLGPAGLEAQRGAIYLGGKTRLLTDLKAGKGSGTYQLGDVTEGQLKGLQRLGVPKTAGREVMMNDEALKHLMDRRMAIDQFSPEEIVRFAEQAMQPRAKAWIDPAGRAHKPSLQNEGFLDPVTGRRYDAQMPLAAKGAGLEVVTVVPRGLPSRKTKAPE